MTAELWLSGVGLRYRRSKVWALEQVSVGGISGAIAVLGPNGAGKTSLFRVLTTTLLPTVGTFGFGDIRSDEPGSADRMRRTLGYLPQDFRAFGGYTCAEFMSYVAWLRQVDSIAVRARVTDSLDVVDLGDRANQKVRSLSGGMRQRLGLAQALVSNPKLLLLDEPTVGLDPEQRAAFMAYLSKVAESTTVVLATHLVEDVATFASSVIVMKEGRPVFQGSLADMCDEPDGSRPTGPQVEQAYLRAVTTGTDR